MQRFWNKVDRTGECWEWLAAKNHLGYGQFRLAGRMQKAHRVAYELAGTPIPEGLEVHHDCRNRGCVNPAHLEAVTHAVNMQRRGYLKEFCHRGHPLVDAPTYGDNPARQCRPCGAERSSVYRRSRREERLMSQ